MSEYHDDLLLRESFTQFSISAAQVAPAPDRREVGAIARRRRRVQVGLVAAVVALLVAAPVAGFALVNRPTRVVPPVAPPSGSPSPSVPASPAFVPDGRISLAQLAQATVNLPAWPAGSISDCPSGRFRFRGARTEVNRTLGPLFVSLEKAVYLDVDRDGAQETAVRISCYIQGGTYQVVVFDRDASGAIVTLGQVVGSGDGAIRDVLDIRADPGGLVGVQVGDIGPIDGSDVGQLAQHQWRSYSWDGRQFYQTGGPTSFPPNPNRTDLAVTATDLHLVPADGAKHGGLKVTIRNNGPANFAKVTVWVRAAAPLTVQTPAGVDCTPLLPPRVEYECTIAAPRAGTSVTLTFGFTGDAALTGSQADGNVTVSGWVATGLLGMDSKNTNNSATFRVLVDG
jgi:hypothetical protein